MIRLALIGNCQVSALAALLTRCRGVTVVAIADVNGRGSPAFIDAIAKIHNRSGIDVVISQVLGPDFGEISTDAIRHTYGDRLYTFTNIYFTGLHPDITYLGGFGKRVISAVGDYHSRIALIAYLKRTAVNDAVAMFRAESYEKLGYFKSFEASATELKARDTLNDIAFASEFIDLSIKELTLLSVNHPTSFALTALAGIISQKVGFDRGALTQFNWINPLAGSAFWPVYPEIGEAIGLCYQTPMGFFPQPGCGDVVLSLESMVTESFALYEEVGRDELLKFPLCQQLLSADV